MDRHEFKKRVIEYAHTIGIDDIGFTTAEPFTEFKAKLIDYYKNGYESGFETGTVEERTNPKASLPNAKSIVSIAVGYPNKLRNAPKSKQGERRGIFARASWGMDYHTLLRTRLEKLEAFLENLIRLLIVNQWWIQVC